MRVGGCTEPFLTFELCWKITSVTSARQDSGEHLILTVSFHPFSDFVCREVTCLSMNKMTHVEKGIDEINSALSIIGAGRTMHLDDISEICKNTCTLPEQWGHVCQLRVLVSNLGLSVNLQSQRADADRQTESRQTERQTQRRTCRYANAAAAIRRQSDIPVRLSMLGGQPADFSHFHKQPSFSTLLETGHCHLLLSFSVAMPISLWEIECSAFQLWAGLQWSAMG